MVSALVFAACGKGVTATPGTYGGGTLGVSGGPLGFPNVGGTCDFISEQDVSSISGFPLTDRSGLARHGASPDPDTKTLCVFADKDGDSVIFSVSAETSDGRVEYDNAVAMLSTPQPLTELGDAATWEGRGFVLRLEVLKGNRAISFSVSLAGHEQTDLLGIAKQLATKVIDNL